jgi:5,10-methylenetetrahydromethanopterin reductase
MSEDSGAIRVGAMYRRHRPPEDLRAAAQRIEAWGFDELWVVEDCFWAGGLTAAAVALAATESITVGMGIVPAVARNAAIAAMELAGVTRMFPGRFVAGVGHGVRDWMDQIGELPASQMAALTETVDAMRRLMDGERLTVEGAHVRLRDVELVFPPRPRPPLVLGITGPRGIDAAAQAADGLMLPEGSSAEYVTAALARFGRPAVCPVYVLFAIDDDVERAAARVSDAVEYFAPPPGDDRLAKLGSPGADVDPIDRIARYAVIGDAASCAASIRRFTAAGATSVILVPTADDDEQFERVASEMLPLLRSA